MAEQIITLGIGATPNNLTPFITTGLEIGAILVITGVIGDAAYVMAGNTAANVETAVLHGNVRRGTLAAAVDESGLAKG